MTVDSLKAINPYISNISWYRGPVPSIERACNNNGYTVQGNPNHPVVLNNNEYAGPIVTFDLLA